MARSSQYPPSVDPGTPIEPPAPEGWQRFTFGDLLDVVERPVALDDDREYQLVNAKRSRGGIAPREKLRGSDIRVKNQFRIEADDFLISKRQIIHGACGVVPKELAGSIVSNEYVVLRPKPFLDINYLRYLSFMPYFQRTCFHSSVGVDVEKMVFKLEQWLRYSLPIPPLPEQRKIAAIVSSVDYTIEKTQAVIEQLEVVKKGLLRELLTGGTPGRHTEYKETEVGKVPSHWQVSRLGNHLREPIRNGFSAHAATQPTGFWIAHVGAVTSSGFKQEAVKPVELGEGRVEKTRLAIGDLLVSRSNTRERVGFAGVYRGVPEWCSYPDLLMRVRPTADIDVDFLEVWLLSPHIREHFKQSARGTSESMVKIDREILENCPVVVPTIEEQREIVLAAQVAMGNLAIENEGLAALQATKAGLLDSLLTGRRRVSIDSQEAA